MTNKENTHRDNDAYRLHDAWRTHIDRSVESIEYLNKADFRAAAAEFSRPYRERIAELEKRLAEFAATHTVDGKTPGQVFDEAFRNGFGKRVVPNPDSELARTHSGELVRDYQREQALDWANATEIGALAVLRVFAAPHLAHIAELEAENAQLRSVFVPPGSALVLIAPEAASQDEMHDAARRATEVHDGPVILLAHDWQSIPVDELRAKIDSVASKHTAPTSDHAHEIGSCSYCDKDDANDEKKP